MRAHGAFTVAAAIMSPEMLSSPLLYPTSVELDMSFENVMSVNVPRYRFHTRSQDPGEIYPYGFAQTSGELDARWTPCPGCFRICCVWPRLKSQPAISFPQISYISAGSMP